MVDGLRVKETYLVEMIRAVRVNDTETSRSEITDFEEVVRLDTEYITNFSIGLDLKILLKTVVVLLQRKGAM